MFELLSLVDSDVSFGWFVLGGGRDLFYTHGAKWSPGFGKGSNHRVLDIYKKNFRN